MVEKIGDPGRIRTCDHSLRRRVLYPAELRGRPPAPLAYRIESRDRQSRRGSAADPIVPKIVGIALRLLSAVMWGDDSVF